MKLRYDQLNAGAWFIKEDMHGRELLHVRPSTSSGNCLTFDLAGNFRTDAFFFRGEEMVEPVTTQIRIMR